jgi:eukaryotic-like serine/threonine-protein kinase
MTLAGRLFSNRYEVVRELAQGGMAEVYLARDQLLDRPVALKALFPEYAREPSFVERFRREAQAAANLNHPNIVAIYDWGQESGTYFIVMEYVEGRSLRDLIRSEAPVDPGQTAEIGAEIAAALGFAHRNGVVHRDVKPGNVLLTRTGNVKVTDFGIARAGTSDGLTQTGSVMGTATYFSPEQAQGQSVDGRSDVYALGVVLYEMVTGVAPFTGDSPVSVAYKHVREDAVPPSQRNPDVPHDLEQIIMTALAKNPDQRYQTADDMRADLLRFRRGRPLAAAPVTAIVSEVPTTASAAAAKGAYAATVATPRVDDRGRLAEGPRYPGRKKSNAALVTFLTLLGLALVVGAILFAAIKLGKSEGHVSVPNEIHKTVAAAKADLAANHLQADVQHIQSQDPVDTVVDQNPKPNTSVVRNSKVTLVVSSGAAQKQIPLDIVNKAQADATSELQQLGFIVTPELQANADFDKGKVVTSQPAPGQSAAIGSTVTLVVSSGAPPKTIPDVSGDTQDQARAALNGQGFNNLTFKAETSDKPQNQVTRTDPPAGQSKSTDTPITVFFSGGPATVPVPDVRTETQDQATTDLQNAGFVVKAFNRFDAANIGKVVDQSPNGGQAPKGSTVVIYVGVAPGSSTTTGGTPTT